MIGCLFGWWRRIRGALDDDRRRWPPLDPGPSMARIHAPTAAQRARRYTPDPVACERACEEWNGPAEDGPRLSTHEATDLAEGDTTRYGYTPPDLGTIDRSGLSIEPW